MKQISSVDFEIVKSLLKSKSPFTFVRFSDGEMEILRNQALFIGNGKIIWRKGSFDFSYPEFDSKEFKPERDKEIRRDLMLSATYKNKNYFKGIPTKHNSAILDRNLMIKENGDSVYNLTFADLLINENYLKFRREIIPTFMNFNDVFILGNFRTRPELIHPNWRLIPIQDNFFLDYKKTVDKSYEVLISLPMNSLVLGSASSLTNILGYMLNSKRQDITFIDIGTSMHDLFGLESGIREYHNLLLKNSLRGIYKKVRLIQRSGFRLKW